MKNAFENRNASIGLLNISGYEKPLFFVKDWKMYYREWIKLISPSQKRLCFDCRMVDTCDEACESFLSNINDELKEYTRYFFQNMDNCLNCGSFVDCAGSNSDFVCNNYYKDLINSSQRAISTVLNQCYISKSN